MWKAIATPTRLLTVIDTSGSMDQPASAGEGSRIEVASRAATGAIQLLADHNSVGLWTFSTRQQGDQDWTQVQPVAQLGTDDQRAKLAFSLGSLGTELGGDTGLYDTVAAAYEAAVKDYDPAANNLIALFTDGVNDDPAGGLDLPGLQKRLAAARLPRHAPSPCCSSAWAGSTPRRSSRSRRPCRPRAVARVRCSRSRSPRTSPTST